MNAAMRDRQDIVNKIKESLVKVYNPSSIYIFVSYAWGTPDEDSDLDFAVIVPDSDLTMAERIRLSYKDLWGIGIPTDILVYTESEIQERLQYKSSLQYKIIHEGSKIYEAA
ncbi:nucleotidyltransferase domain-containing protein [Salinispira pacifica]|uniref:Nucleotidyltransferase domain protein n=1 Tax=Salinispira pacifica TaxID=1307761 RepID=V5WI62_9SPIO|nr:nucleotidyltransferase domain-containing protein [Salinispira pacifica]AHC14861.1 Nucleotidyltransferase domain protein [Salinispira pacifica]